MRMWRNWNPQGLLVGRANGAAAVDKLWRLLRQSDRTASISHPTSGCRRERMESRHSGPCTPVFTALLFTVATGCPHPMCPSTGKWINTMGSIHMTDYD